MRSGSNASLRGCALATGLLAACPLFALDAPMPIALDPHFYQTWWFDLLAVLSAALLFTAGYLLRIRHLGARERELVRLIDERTRAIAEEHAAVVRAAGEVEHLAYHDVLTRLPNRALFMDRLIMALAQARRGVARPAVLFLDVDRFKEINDSLGHHAGDLVLSAVADRIRSHLRESDSVARFGGDEFTILLPSIVTGEDAARIADKLIQHIREPMYAGERELYVTASIGISVYPTDGDDAETLVMNADAAMYRAKEAGRDNYQLYARSMNDTAMERLGLENNLRKAMAQNELVVHYQPLIELDSGRIFGAEALVRWSHPERGLLLPADFLDLAEVTGLIIPIGSWVLRTACFDAKRWQGASRRPLVLSVNLSARQFQHGSLAAEVADVLDESGLDPSLLHLEITENNAMKNPEETIRTLNELKRLGVLVALDDFGTGYSSLNYLKRFPVDVIKLDQSFVRDLATDSQDRAIASAIIHLAHDLGICVIAEGVESSEQLRILRRLRCDHMQGFLFASALAFHEVERFIAASPLILQAPPTETTIQV
jgi:diguanylate cyclase (GGDEF)-like protein